jgi:hypothetical protein
MNGDPSGAPFFGRRLPQIVNVFGTRPGHFLKAARFLGRAATTLWPHPSPPAARFFTSLAGRCDTVVVLVMVAACLG